MEENYVENKENMIEDTNKSFEEALDNLNKNETKEENVDLDKEIQDLIDGKVEADNNFTLEELSKEDKKLLTEEEIKVYEIGFKLQADEEKRELDLLKDFDNNIFMPEEIVLLGSKDIIY